MSTMTLLLMSCVAINNPFKASTGTRTDTCKTDFSLPIELERANFLPAEIWSRIKPCEMVKVGNYTKFDSWNISASLHYTYADVLVYDTAMGFGVNGNLNLIGSTPATMEGWKQREDKKWLKHLKYRGKSDKRNVIRETRNGLKCWRETTISFEQGKQSALSIAYDCWESDKTHYPPLSISGSIRYWDGKPVYDLDIDKDLIDPVFATLEVKDIKPEVYAERMAIHEEKMERLESCGYDTSKLKKKEES